MKKILFLVMCIFLSLSFTSCTDDEGIIDDRIVYEDDDYVYLLSNDKSYFIVKEVKNKEFTNVVIPPTFNNLPVKEIAERVFDNNDNLEEVNLSNVEIVGESSFNNCDNLTTVISPNLKVVKDGGFGYCFKLKTIDLSNLICAMQLAFAYCRSIETLKLPKIETIEKAAFVCDNLKELELGDNIVELAPSFFKEDGEYGHENEFFKLEDGALILNDKYVATMVEDKTYYKVPSKIRNVFETLSDGTENIKLEVDENHPYLKTIDGNLYTKDGKILLKYLNKDQGVFNLPDQTEEVSRVAFEKIKAVGPDVSIAKFNINNATNIKSFPLNVKNFEVSSENEAYTVLNNSLYSKNKDTLVYYADDYKEEFKLPDEAKVIATGAIKSDALKVLDLNNVIKLDTYSVLCNNLVEVKTLKLKEFKYRAITRIITNMNLSTIEILESPIFLSKDVKVYDYSNVKIIEDYALTSLEDVTIKLDKVEYIGSGALFGDKNVIIEYTKTKEEFEKIPKDVDWNVHTKNIEVKCSDGSLYYTVKM